jgi:hypothetical protein
MGKRAAPGPRPLGIEGRRHAHPGESEAAALDMSCANLKAGISNASSTASTEIDDQTLPEAPQASADRSSPEERSSA